MPIVHDRAPAGKAGARAPAHNNYRPSDPPNRVPPTNSVGSGQSDPRDPLSLFARLITARQQGDIRGSLELRRELLKAGWSISPTAPSGRGAR